MVFTIAVDREPVPNSKLLTNSDRGSVRKPLPINLVQSAGRGVLASRLRVQYDGAALPFMDLGMAIAKRETAAAAVRTRWVVNELHLRRIRIASHAGVIDAINALVGLHENLRRTRATAET